MEYEKWRERILAIMYTIVRTFEYPPKAKWINKTISEISEEQFLHKQKNSK